VTGFPAEVRELVFERAKGCCERCHVDDTDMQYHHRRPRGMGGSKADDTNAASNCLLLCGSCHRDIESQRKNSLHYGWIVRQGAKPAEIPIWMEWQWVLLTDEGQVVPK
jgi:5-methylcytosine-specific restriction protein A